jgi:hypothetical protein
MEQCGKKRIQKKLPNGKHIQQLLYIYSKGTLGVNKYIVPYNYQLFNSNKSMMKT